MCLNTTSLCAKETLDDKDLQAGHGDNGETFQRSEPKYSTNCRRDSSEITVLSGAEVLLRTSNIGDRSRNS